MEFPPDDKLPVPLGDVGAGGEGGSNYAPEDFDGMLKSFKVESQCVRS